MRFQGQRCALRGSLKKDTAQHSKALKFPIAVAQAPLPARHKAHHSSEGGTIVIVAVRKVFRATCRLPTFKSGRVRASCPAGAGLTASNSQRRGISSG
jgi:hypothetical protein